MKKIILVLVYLSVTACSSSFKATEDSKTGVNHMLKDAYWYCEASSTSGMGSVAVKNRKRSRAQTSALHRCEGAYGQCEKPECELG